MADDTEYEEITEVEATERGLLEEAQYRRDDDGVHRAYHDETRTFWKLGTSPFPMDPGLVGHAIKQAQDVLDEQISGDGGRVLCSIMLVHADGLPGDTPGAGVDVHCDEDDGPQSPEDVLEFAVAAVGQLAKRLGIPFAVMEGPSIGAQG
jgi:hypothetical protein